MSRAKVECTPPVHQLAIRRLFDGLSKQERRYAHHLARAAWHGARIVHRQVSPESSGIYDLILGLHGTCQGNWDSFVENGIIGRDELETFLNYAATFLSNIGNYYGSGDQKFVPDLDPSVLEKLVAVSASPGLGDTWGLVKNAMFCVPPYTLGYPSVNAQSSYYPDGAGGVVNQDEIAVVSRTLADHGILPENTRIRKNSADQFDVLLASVDKASDIDDIEVRSGAGRSICVTRGDHSEHLQRVVDSLTEAAKFASNDTQRSFLSQYVQSFRTGDLETYRDSQRAWISDKQPRIENIFGFVEPYRDPHGIRAEFEGIVAMSDVDETRTLLKLVERSDRFIKRLPWAGDDETVNNGKGYFEKDLFDPPDFSSIHALAYCSSIVFPGINLPNYNDIRQENGFKNVIIANRMDAESDLSDINPFIGSDEAEVFQRHKYSAYYWWVVLHELLGHGTGKMMVEESGSKFNFDVGNPPMNPLTNSPISCWYKPGQTWTGQFGDLATTVDECRAELVGAYLMDDNELLELFGFDDHSDPTGADVTYNLYLQLGTDGLRGLADFNPESGTWGQAHARAHFAMMKCLLTDADDFMRIEFDREGGNLTVRVDRRRILSHGKPALGRMLLKLHMFRCTADVAACREYYESLTRVEEEHLEWRRAVLARRKPKWIYVQANTFLEGDEVVLKEYEPTPLGVIQSWADRNI